MELDAKLCYCFHVSKRKVVNFIRQTKPKRASQVSQCFGAGTGCGWCIPFLKKLHREIVGDGIVEGDDISSSEYESMRTNYRQDVAAGKCSKNQMTARDERAEDETDEYTAYFSRTRDEPDSDDSHSDAPDSDETAPDENSSDVD